MLFHGFLHRSTSFSATHLAAAAFAIVLWLLLPQQVLRGDLQKTLALQVILEHAGHPAVAPGQLRAPLDGRHVLVVVPVATRPVAFGRLGGLQFEVCGGGNIIIGCAYCCASTTAGSAAAAIFGHLVRDRFFHFPVRAWRQFLGNGRIQRLPVIAPLLCKSRSVQSTRTVFPSSAAVVSLLLLLLLLLSFFVSNNKAVCFICCVYWSHSEVHRTDNRCGITSNEADCLSMSGAPFHCSCPSAPVRLRTKITPRGKSDEGWLLDCEQPLAVGLQHGQRWKVVRVGAVAVHATGKEGRARKDGAVVVAGFLFRRGVRSWHGGGGVRCVVVGCVILGKGIPGMLAAGFAGAQRSRRYSRRKILTMRSQRSKSSRPIQSVGLLACEQANANFAAEPFKGRMPPLDQECKAKQASKCPRERLLQVGGTKYHLVLRLFRHDHGTSGESLKRAATEPVTAPDGTE